MGIRIQFLGSGDAYASGGRLQTCILVEGMGPRFVFDCGATALAAMRTRDVDPNHVGLILLTHLHGDHFSGVPFFIIDATDASGREKPLTIAGPPGTRARIEALGDVLFPGMWNREVRFPLTFVEMTPETPYDFDGLTVTPYPVAHSPAANPTGEWATG